VRGALSPSFEISVPALGCAKPVSGFVSRPVSVVGLAPIVGLRPDFSLRSTFSRLLRLPLSFLFMFTASISIEMVIDVTIATLVVVEVMIDVMITVVVRILVVMVIGMAIGAIPWVIVSVGLDMHALLAYASRPCFSARGDSPDCYDCGR
jgi:hypothetical protein